MTFCSFTFRIDIQSTSYANMDLAFLSTLLLAFRSGIKRVLVSYDIGCQWHKNLEKRLALYSASSNLKLSSLSYWRVVVPKFHLAGHGTDCQLAFNINFTHGAGRMTGEMIESGWAQSNSMAIWTRENGPFTRRAVLDDHWNSENWRKLRRLRKQVRRCSLPSALISFPGTSLLKNLQNSLAWSKAQRLIAEDASQSLSKETLAEWTQMRLDFDQDRTKPNPYEEPETCESLELSQSFSPLNPVVVTMESLKRRLDEDERRELRQGRTPSPHTVSANIFVCSALEVEREQYVIRTALLE